MQHPGSTRLSCTYVLPHSFLRAVGVLGVYPRRLTCASCSRGTDPPGMGGVAMPGHPLREGESLPGAGSRAARASMRDSGLVDTGWVVLKAWK